MMEQAHDPEQKIAERYFLGELTDAEAEAFEAHYFECPPCAEYVVEEQMLLDSGRAVAREQKVAPAAVPAPVVDLNERRRRRFQWMPAAAAAAMLVIALGLPMMPGSGTSVALGEPHDFLMSANRAEAEPAMVLPPAPVLILHVEAVPEEKFAKYELYARNSVTDEVVDHRLRLVEAHFQTAIPFVLRDLPVGTYEVVIEGVREDGKRSTITTKAFEVRGQQ
jgi:hypothetical protein